MSMRIAEEHVARIKAEGEAADAARRLAVAQEQIAEYAAQRETEAADLVAQASSIVAFLQGNGPVPEIVRHSDSSGSDGLALRLTVCSLHCRHYCPLSLPHSSHFVI
jgi:hypothetical protein